MAKQLFSYPNPFFEEKPSKTPLIVLHGVLGSGLNFQSFLKNLAYPAVALDLRNHNQSPWDDQMDYISMAEDVYATLERWELEPIYLLGHSMGGKVAMTFALLYPDRLEKLLVLDMAPVDYPHHQGFYQRILPFMMGLEMEKYQLKSEIQDQLLKVMTPKVAEFILTNAVKQEKGFRWRVNLAAVYQNLPKIVGFPTKDDLQLQHPLFTKDTSFLGGANSDYITIENQPKMHEFFPTATLARIDAGHWVHAEKPAEFAAWVKQALPP